MKHTKYFSDYQSAYNYYGGNVVPSTEIALVGNGSYVFVSSDNFNAVTTNDEIVDTMTAYAYTAGSSYGYDLGYADGYSYGYSVGYAEANNQN